MRFTLTSMPLKSWGVFVSAAAVSCGAVWVYQPAVAALSAMGFYDGVTTRNDLTGSLAGTVQFAQSHTIDPAGNAAKEMPSLVTQREALLMFTPAASMGAIAGLQVTATLNGQTLGTLNLAAPSDFPAPDGNASDGRPSLNYSTKAWSVKLPWQWMRQGLTLNFKSAQGATGQLAANRLEFSGAAEVVLQNIRIGMLTDPPPNDANLMERSTGEFAIDYFQKIPVSRLSIGQYLPIKLTRVVMANGKVYTTASSTNGGVYDGDMREEIGKSLISTGINLANYGISESVGGAQSNPTYFRQVVVHQSVGVYANGVQQHGLSGGGGIATLYTVDGNEFSHELGHNWELGHYPGGGQWSSHNQNSGWGYDGYLHRMVGNIDWTRPAYDNVVEGVTTPSFKGLYGYGSDAMAGGAPMGKLSNLTHHTGYSAKRIQEALVKTPVLNPASASGYDVWDANARNMVAYSGSRLKPAKFGVPVVTLVGYYDPQGTLPTTIYPALYGNFGNVFNLPYTSTNPCHLSVTMKNGTVRRINLSGQRLNAGVMNKFHVNLDASEGPQKAEITCTTTTTVSTSSLWWWMRPTSTTQTSAKVLNTMNISPPAAALPPAVTVGREAGYGVAAITRPQPKDLLAGRVFPSVQAYEQALADSYGPLRQWGDTPDRQVSTGALFVYDNAYTGVREYFMVKRSPYWYFPTSGSSNDDWRYMGHSMELVDLKPEPFRAKTVSAGSLDERVAAYYGVTAVRRSGDGLGWVQKGQVFRSDAGQYLMLKSSNGSAFLPAVGQSNADWAQLGSAADMTVAFGLATVAETMTAFEARVVSWHKLDRIHTWNESGVTKGIPGQLYRYDTGSAVRYFRLKTPGYWYFPTNNASNEYWEYVGAYR